MKVIYFGSHFFDLNHFKQFILAKKIIVLKKKVKREESKTKESPPLACKFSPHNKKNTLLKENQNNKPLVEKIEKIQERKVQNITEVETVEIVPKTAELRRGNFIQNLKYSILIPMLSEVDILNDAILG